MTTAAVRGPAFRRVARNALVRHVRTALLAVGLVPGFAAVHAEWSPMDRWNRAFGGGL